MTALQLTLSSRTENRIPFALRDGKPVEVYEVERGRACGCVCPACGHPLRARKGKKNVHHFAHDHAAGPWDCKTAFETSIHLMAKEILREDGFLVFPELVIKRSAEDQIGVLHTEETPVSLTTEKSFQRVELEKRLEGIRPDIVAYVDGNPVIVEVAVTSFAQQEKKQRIRRLRLPAIEIDLSSVDYSTTKEDLRNRIHLESTKKEWLSNPKAIEVIRRVEASLAAEVQRANDAYRRNAHREPSNRSNELPVRSAATFTPTSIYTSEGTEKTRWFRCEACCCVFEMPVSAAPSNSRSVTCPDCGHIVSTDQRRTR